MGTIISFPRANRRISSALLASLDAALVIATAGGNAALIDSIEDVMDLCALTEDADS